jgi:hypothetical protein
MVMEHKRSYSACRNLLFLKNKPILLFYGTVIPDNQFNTNLGLMQMMAKMFYFNQYIYMEKDFIQIPVLKKKTSKAIYQGGFLTIQYFQGQQHLKNGERQLVTR